MCTGGSQKRIDGPHSVKYSFYQYFCGVGIVQVRPPAVLFKGEIQQKCRISLFFDAFVESLNTHFKGEGAYTAKIAFL